MSIIDFASEDLDDFERRAIRRRSSRGELRRLRPGVFATHEPVSPEQQHVHLVESTILRAAPNSVVSHISAAILHGLPVLRSRIGRVTVLRGSSNGRKTTFLHARRAHLASHEIGELNGLPVTTLARTVYDLAATLPFGEALGAADAALRLQPEVVSEIDLDRAPLRVRRVVASASAKSESMGESMSRAVFIRFGIPAAELQFEVRNGRGDVVARCDFGWRRWGLVGEFDGLVKYSGTLAGAADPQAVIRDEKIREERLRDLGLDVVRWGWDAVQHPEHLAGRITRALERHGYRGRPARRSPRR